MPWAGGREDGGVEHDRAIAEALARHTAEQVDRSHLPMAATIALVVVHFSAQLDSAVVVWWGGFAALNVVRAVVTNERDKRAIAAGRIDRFLVWSNALYGSLFGVLWGSLWLIATTYGNDTDGWVATIVLLAAMSITAVVTAGSRTTYLSMLAGAGSTLVAGWLTVEAPDPTLAVLELLYFAVAIHLHDALHTTLRANVASTQANTSLAQRLADMAAHQDPLTKLLNRDGLHALVENWQEAAPSRHRIAVAVGNVERLSSINELFGVRSGDVVLDTIATRLRSIVASGSAMARLSGDEFAVVRRVEHDIDAAAVRDELIRSVFDPIVLDGQPVDIGLSSAVVVGSAADLDLLLVEASSMVRDERSRRSPTLLVGRGSLDHRRQMMDELRSGLAGGEVGPWFQPIVDCRSGRIVGWEALARWEHPSHGIVPPLDFLGLAELGGMTSELTDRMLGESLRFVAELVAGGDVAAASVHVNLSATQARRPDLTRLVDQLLARYRLDSRTLTIEMTEQEVPDVDGVLLGNLQTLVSRGVGVAIDDFGTGYSSLSHLLDIRATELKIDKRFIDGILVDGASVELVRAVIGLAKGLGLRTVAEGVEESEQAAFLAANGCDAFQGFVVSPAQRPEDAREFLATWVPQPNAVGDDDGIIDRRVWRSRR